MATYKGDVVFVDGVHYPVQKSGDDQGHADTSRPLRYDTEAGGYRDAEEDEPLHNDANHLRGVDLEIGGE